jgi:hypothetical protein
MVEKALDRKLAEIRSNPKTKTFILADAKDPDMAFGVAAPGRKSPEFYGDEVEYRSLPEFRNMIREVVRQGVVDIMLMSPSTNEILTIEERLFETSRVTPAARVNDTTDIHVVRGGVYPTEASRPFRTATLDHIQCGLHECSDEDRVLGANLGLYSVTFNNDRDRDLETLQHYKEFRIEAEQKGFRHFLEVFDPNVPEAVKAEDLAAFVNDQIARTLGGVTRAGMPLFLKMVYHGPKAMEELANYNPDLPIGILGGSSGTTYDAFKLIGEAQKYGARVALFGRKIKDAEHQLALIEFLRLITDGEISPEEAVPAYHGVLQGLGIKPFRSLEEDMKLQTNVMSYAASGTTVPVPEQTPVQSPETQAAAVPSSPQPASAPVVSDSETKAEFPTLPDGSPDFDRMTPAQKIEWGHRERSRILGPSRR